MHQLPFHQPSPQGCAGRLIWLVAGTGDGPPLAAALLARGWWVRVSVVSPEALRAYAPHPRLLLQAGSLDGLEGVERQLVVDRPAWVVDASHPFAARVSQQLATVCQRRGQPWIGLQRPAVPADVAVPPERLLQLADLQDLQALDLSGEHLLLAIGSRQLPAALVAIPGAVPFARVLDRPASLQLALAAGLPDGHLACLKPEPRADGLLELALCRRWQITAVLCRQSGGAAEAIWHRVCRQGQQRLLLLEPPAPPAGAIRLPLAALLEKLGNPEVATGQSA
jgi:precorrin-6A/cobalt-precorrin-6A reductase